MAAERQFQGRWKAEAFIFICAVIVVLSGNCLFAAEQTAASPRGETAGSGVARYRVFSLKHISAEKGKKYLAEAGVGTVSQLPGVNALLVTAKAQELIKASAILDLVDAEELFYIKAITSASEATHFPSNEQIAAEVNDISIGTFSNPPRGTAKYKAIIDVHNDTVIAIAPAEQFERIISAIERLRSGEAQAPQRMESNKPTEANKASRVEAEGITEAELQKAEAEAEAELKRIAASFEIAGQATDDYEADELLDKLISSIAETEKVPVLQKEGKMETEEIAAEEQTPQLSQPNAVATAPEINEPPAASLDFAEKRAPQGEDESNLVDLKQAEESAPPPPEEQEPNLSDEEPEAEPNLEPVSKVHSYEPAPIANGNEMLELDLPEKLNIIDLVDLVGKYLQLDYMYDETQVKGEVSLKLQGPIKVKDLYPLLESVLKFRGFVMSRKGNLVTIVPAAEALGIDPLLYPEAGKIQLGDVVITRVFNLDYIDTASAQNLLVNMKLGANISQIPETGTLIVTEYAYRMARVEELLDMVDQPGEPKQFRFRQLKYTMATTLAPKIKTLAEQLGAASVTIAAPAPARQPTRRTRRGRRAPTPTPAAPAATAKPTVYLDADERTNRILMIGLEDELVVLESLIDSLDVEQQDLRTLRLYDIQHVGAEEVVNKLQELNIIGGSPTTGRITTRTRAAPGREPSAPATAASAAETEPLVEAPQVVVIESTNSLLVNATAEQHVRIATIISYVDSVTLEQAIPYVIYGLENQSPEDLAGVLQQLIQETVKDKEGKIQQTIKKTEEDIIIVPDENTFSIIVYASKKNQEWIGNLIRQLDKRRPQVLLDAMLVEISEADAFNYDLQLVTKYPRMEPGGTMDKLTSLTPFSSERIITEATSILGDASPAQGFYATRHIQALLKLMQKKGYGRVLARPKILVNDNEQGHIDTTNTIYVARSASSVTDTGTTTISTSYTFDQFPSGINLDITPHISEGSLLRLEIKMTRSSQPAPEGGVGKDEPPPNKSENNISTVVTVPDDSTIILGGITTLEQTKDNWKVPLLGDVPLVGGLFRRIDNSSRQAKLYIFVKANILRPSETVAGLPDLERISDRTRAAFEGSERRFQEYHDWPGIEPEPMDPLRVLEAE